MPNRANEQILADYIEERLPENEKERVRSYTLECGYCLKCVRHYIANRSELEKRLEKEVFSPATGREADKSEEFFQRKIQTIMGIFSRRVPVLTGAPAFALAPQPLPLRPSLCPCGLFVFRVFSIF